MSELTGIPLEETHSPLITENTSTKIPKPIGTLPPAPAQMWDNVFSDIGSMGDYPRPQGNLPAFTWQLTLDTQKEMKVAYSNVLYLDQN